LATCTGMLLLVIEPSPSCPAVPSPQHHALPFASTAQEWCSPPEIFQAAVDPEAFHEVRKGLGYPQLPAVYVRADICRPELLFELDAAAAITK